MSDSLREFPAGPDPAGRMWQVRFIWLQTAISIRKADAVDVKYVISDGEVTEEKVVALPHRLLRERSRAEGKALSDAWCMTLASAHLRRMIETGEDIEKPLVTVSAADLEEAAKAPPPGLQVNAGRV